MTLLLRPSAQLLSDSCEQRRAEEAEHQCNPQASKVTKPAYVHRILSSSWVGGITYTPHGYDALGRATGILTLLAVHNGRPSLIVLHEVPSYMVGLLRAADANKLKGKGNYSVGRFYHHVLKGKYPAVEQKDIPREVVQAVYNRFSGEFA